MHPASRGFRWEPESSWGRAFLRRRIRRQTLRASKGPLVPDSGGAKFPGASGTLSAPGRPSSHRNDRRKCRYPRKQPKMQVEERRVVGGDQHTDRRQILGRMHPASRGFRWEPESSWGRAFLRRRIRRQTLRAGKGPLVPDSGGAKFPGASGTLSAPGRPSSHRNDRRKCRYPPETAENARGGAPRRGGRPTYRQTPNFRADASRKSGFSLGAGVELGESFSAPADPASNASGE